MDKIFAKSIEKLFSVQMIFLFITIYLINTFVMKMPFLDAVFILLLSILVSFIVFLIGNWRSISKEEKLE